MVALQSISYVHPSKDVLFKHLDLTVNKFDKIALIGNNGSGKSTLLKIINGDLQKSDGQLSVEVTPYLVPQVFGQFNDLTISQALGIHEKVEALREILNGNASYANMQVLADDWTIEERCHQALRYWELENSDLNQRLKSLSGGQKTKVFLAGIMIHQPELVLMDEPSNHLDTRARKRLYQFVESTRSTMIVVTHDRMLLNLFSRVCELTHNGINVYGGNYKFFLQQKGIQKNALNQDILAKERMLKKLNEKEREANARKQKLDARGKGKQEKAGVARIMMNTLRNNAEKSTAKIRGVHADKVNEIAKEVQDLRASLPDIDKMLFGFNNSRLHRGKQLFRAVDINFTYGTAMLWKNHVTIGIVSGERVALKGGNGAGKTALIKIITGDLVPSTGIVFRSETKAIYIDQDYSLIDNNLSVYQQAQTFNDLLQEHEIKIRLNRFLFTRQEWDKPCSALSGGERMRLMLCCLTVRDHAPDIIVLDEPTNNLDLQNVDILIKAINEYRGTLVVVSHDEMFLEQVNINKTVELR